MQNVGKVDGARSGFAVSSNAVLVGSAILVLLLVLSAPYLNGVEDGDGYRITSLGFAVPMVLMLVAVVRKLTKRRPDGDANDRIPSTGKQLDDAEIDAMIARHAHASAAKTATINATDRRQGAPDRRNGANRQQGFGRRSTDSK
jgi:hypothetical protein